MSTLEQINRAIDSIEAHLPAALPIDRIAREAGISKWHFQRVFLAMVGETVMDYVRRRRLSLAAQALLDSDFDILDIAVAHEFDSHEVFTRAFKRVFETTPSEFRAAKGPRRKIPLKPRITLEYLNHLYKGVTMQPEITRIARKSVIGLSNRIQPVDVGFARNRVIIAELWKNLFAEAEQLPESRDARERVGVISGPELEYLAGFFTKTDRAHSDRFKSVQIPEGDYAEFTHKGPIGEVDKTYNYIYGSWLPKSGRKRSDGPEFAVYPIGCDPSAADAELKIYVPLV